MGTKIHPKSMKNRGCVADAFLERFWAALGTKRMTASKFCRTLLDPKKYQKIDAEKVLKIDAKRAENEAKIDTKINDV